MGVEKAELRALKGAPEINFLPKKQYEGVFMLLGLDAGMAALAQVLIMVGCCKMTRRWLTVRL
jgi:hypothetical protein